MYTRKSGLTGQVYPQVHHFITVRNTSCLINQEHWSSINTNVTWIQEERQEIVEMCFPILLSPIILRHQHLMSLAVPCACPGFVGPGETERHFDICMLQQLFRRFLQKHLPAKPVMVEAETAHSIFLGQTCLPAHDLDIRQIIVPVQRYTRLAVSRKKRTSFPDIGPISKSRSPPFVIFGNCMELWQIKSYDFGRHRRYFSTKLRLFMENAK